ncbi:MAG: HEAT repeat domain-containing protein [Myxococcales bacterium]
MTFCRATGTAKWLMPLALVLVSGCASAWLDVAQRASLPELKREIRKRQRTGAIDAGETRELARAVLSREIRSAVDPDGESLFGGLTDCVREIDAQLWERSRRDDHSAGAALLALAHGNKALSDQVWREAARASCAYRRAAAARASGAPERWMVRAALLNDPDQRVRKAALEACIEAPTQLHYASLVSILGRDPNAECRGLAAKALGVLGGSTAETVLSDTFEHADRELRLAIVSAWTRTRTFTVGGKAQLIQVARAEPGIVGALAGADLAHGDSDAREIGHARISRSLQFGADEERHLAVSAADWSREDQAQWLIRLGLDLGDAQTRALALGRWLEQARYEWPGRTWLRSLAETDESAGIEARSILAAAGDHWAVGPLRAQLRYAAWQSRARAARDLWRLEDAAGFAIALADDAPEVRVAAACAALALSKP